MASPALASPLLLSDGSAPAAPWRRSLRLAAAAAAALPGLLALFIAVAGLPPSQEGRIQVPSGGGSEVMLRSLANRSEVLDTVMVPRDAQCYGYTGGTCVAASCNTDRNAECISGKCSCSSVSRMCSGGDGVCHTQGNKLVAESFHLTNMKWPAQKMRMPGVTIFSQVGTSSAPTWYLGQEAQFNLWELPGRVGGKKMYFLSSAKWPTWVAAIRSTTLTAASVWGLYALNLEHSIAPWDPQSIVVHLCSLDKAGHQGAVMIGSPGLTANIWAYIHHGSWDVYGWMLSEDPGPGGYWTPDKPLEGLEDC